MWCLKWHAKNGLISQTVFFFKFFFDTNMKTITENSAVMISVIQNAFHTPLAPIARLNKNAAGRMISTYLNREIQSDVPPFPSPSSAPDTVTLSADGMNPMQMMGGA